MNKDELRNMPTITVEYPGNKKNLVVKGFITVHGEIIQVQRVEFIAPKSKLEINQDDKVMIVERWYLPSHSYTMIHVDGDMPS